MLDVTDALFSEGEVFYQWVTLVNQDDSSDAFTIGCKMTKVAEGATDTQVINYFTMDGDNAALGPTSDLVVDLVWTAQAPDLLEEDADHVWVASSEHSPSVAASETDENTVFSCFLAEELPKIGRNPADFGMTYDITIGARIYETEDATTFITIPSVTSTVTKEEPPTYVVEAEEEEEDEEPEDDSSYTLFASSMAFIACLFMAF